MKKLFTNKQKFIYRFILNVLVLFGFILLYKYYQSSVHIKIKLEEVEYIQIGSNYGQISDNLDKEDDIKKIVKLFNSMTHIKRDLTGIGTTVENPFIIQLITGETISLQPIGEDKWIVNIEGRPWQWIDYWGAPDLDYWNIVAYFGKQSELREIYADLIGM
jgi:hypothetical protein